MKGHKADSGKLEWHLLPRVLLRGVVQVLMFGRDRYGERNWMRVKNARVRYMDALERHLDAYQAGEYNDQESGKSHLDHAMCCLLFLRYFERKDRG
jgi:hypothetical protein